MFQKNNSFSAKPTSNKNKNSSRLQRRTKFGGLYRFPDLFILLINTSSLREIEFKNRCKILSKLKKSISPTFSVSSMVGRSIDDINIPFWVFSHLPPGSIS